MAKFIVTHKWLDRRGACSGQVEDFKRVFPNGAELNPENLERAKRAGLSVNWFAIKVIGPRWYWRQQVSAQQAAEAELGPGHTLDAVIKSTFTVGVRLWDQWSQYNKLHQWWRFHIASLFA